MNEINCVDEQIKSFPIAIVVSRFNQSVTKKLADSALERLSQRGFSKKHITVTHVPGAVEIPLVVKRLAEQKKFRAIVTLGAVIRGETSHYDYVCEQVSQGCQHIALATSTPVIFGILTTENSQQALARAGGAHSNKGYEAIDSAIEMVAVLDKLQELTTAEAL